MKTYSAGPLVLGGTSGFNLTDVKSRSIEPNLEIARTTASGQALDSFLAVLESNAMESLQTGQIGTLLSKVDAINGLAFPGTNINALDLYWVQNNPAGDRLPGSVHVKTTMNAGRLMVKTIKAEQKKIATADIEAHALYDGTNPFYAVVDSQALPSITYTVSEQYTLGPVSINGSALTDVQGWTYDQNANIEKLASQGLVFPDHLYLGQVQPSLTVDGLDASILATVGITGVKQGATASTFYLRKLDVNGQPLPAASTVHVKITVNANQGLVYPGAWSGTPTSKAGGSILILPTVGSNPILTIATGVAIT